MYRALLFSLVGIPALAGYLISNHWDGMWWTPWFILSCLLVVPTAFYAGKKFHPCIIPALLSSAWGALELVWGQSRYYTEEPATQLVIRTSAGYFLVTLLLFTVLFSWLKKKHIRDLEDAFGWLGFANAVLVLGQWVYGSPILGGLFKNPSMSGCLIAITLPLFYRIAPRRWMVLFAVTAILIQGRNIPIGLLVLVTCVRLIPDCRVLALPILAFLASMPMWMNRVLLNGRLETWTVSMKWWWANANHWFGMGPGTSLYWLPEIERRQYLRENWFFIMHSDWLQILFEQGIIGFVCAALVYVVAIKKSAQRRTLFASLVGYGTCAAVNFPLYLPSHALLGGVLVASALRRDE